MSELALIAAGTFGLCLAMACAWRVRLATGKSGWIDAIWTVSTGALCIAYALAPITPGQPDARDWLIATMAALWALRLGSHIVSRTRRGGDDPRYAELAQEWGRAFPQRLFLFLQLQGLAGALLALSAWLAARNPAPAGLTDVLGVAVFVAAAGGEALADSQLAAFRRDPANRGKVCARGLWAWSRHPNYFFEWMVWLAFAIMAVDPSGAWPWGALAFLAPLYMFWLLTRVSGLPPLERHMARSRGAAWRDYAARTSAFLPRPPKRNVEPERS
ncbi:DUF1295 domain-containing protein [Caulobacter sp. 17J80-11]|uniref:DUF1295 domain-containing protein n=1 Tax=Caulobacter sp. 17J80-11 TaxID=2763502 RepID=UPI001653C2B1|nr:DUF1295 domain-containing protein [Caulobacter sp. 17J80-11]MBC6982598.1 DUF1295 domain-containing protein [Caulobacter sp. 17J80-11]